MATFSMKVKGVVALISFKKDKYILRLMKHAREQNKAAVKVWLIAVLERIPTFTGTARGTFAPLGRTVNYIVTRVGPAGGPFSEASAARAALKKHIVSGGKTFVAGFSAGGNYAHYSLDTQLISNGIVNTFIFTNDLPYVAYNDVNPAPKGYTLPSNPPWRAYTNGLIAWRKYIRSKVTKHMLPPKALLKIKHVKV